ncbi:MAG: glycosyltransferase [Lentisphaeria bacterium]|nr:glycosyltransferase [Lentisphaeria bacterium]
MNILQITTESRVAGAERVVASLSRGLRERGHRVTVVSLMPLPQDEAETIIPALRAAGVDIVSLGITKFTPWKVWGLKKIVADFKPDVIHSHLIHANIAARLFTGRPSAPLINTVHIAESRPTAWWRFWLDKVTLKRCAVQTAVSKSVADFHARKLGVDPETMPVITNGISQPAKCSPTRIAELHREWEVADCAKVIGSVGRLHAQKGYDRLLKALPDVGKIIPDGDTWGIVILGEGPQRAALESLAERAPGNVRVRLPGFRDDAADCAGAFDLFVMPSRYEGFGLTLAEAMAHGVPILASDLDVLREVADGYPSIVFTDFTFPTGLVEEIIDGPGLNQRSPFAPFSTDQMTESYETLYQKHLSF